MKITKQAILLSAVALGLGACSEENPWGYNAGEGGISLKVETSTDVKDAIPMLRSGVETLEAPELTDFAISLKNLANDQEQKWMYDDFSKQNSFAAGSYTLAASYGAPEDEGFEKPYFYGEAQVQVLESRTSEVSVTASLANSMISVDYTDAFKNYFKDYKVTVHSQGHSFVDFEKGEVRPAFVAPGEVELTVNVTNPNGQSVTLQPASFPAAARHHYHITFDVNGGNVGTAQLQIVFDDSVVTEDVTIDLTDELFTSPAPKVSPVGFTDGQMLEALEGSSLGDKIRFDVIARGGLKSAKLSISAENGYEAPCGSEVDLISAPADVQAKLAEMGIKAVGMYKEPQSMAFVDLTEFATKLDSKYGKYSVSLQVVDGYTRSSEPLTVNFSSVPLVIEATPGTAIFGANTGTVVVDYNGLDPQSNIKFKALSKAGVFKDATVIECKESTRTRSIETKTYTFTLSLPDTGHDLIDVKVIFGGKERTTVKLPVEVPEYEVAVDAFAHYAKMKITAVNASGSAVLPALTNSMRLFVDGKELKKDNDGKDPENVVRNTETGIITITGLTASKAYTFGASLFHDTPDKTISATTEAESQIPNNDFSQTVGDINMTDVQVGGTYTGTVFDNPKYHYSSSIVTSMPKGWASINAKTCWSGAKNVNTWYCVPSTYAENGATVVRSVGYSHNGTSLGNTKKTAVYYCQNSPSFSDNDKIAGELFLGDYGFDGSEHRTDGIGFTSRPSSMTFSYTYIAYGGEKARVEVALVDAAGTVISSTSSDIDPASSMSEKTVSLPSYAAFGKKAASIRVRFISSTASVPTINVPTGEQINEYKLNGIGNGLKNNTLKANAYHCFATGSVLTVDNVKLNY